MGLSHSWIAVRGLTREQALETLAMEVSDVETDFIDGIALFDWPGDWLVVISDDDEDALEGRLAELGPLGEAAVACSVNEHVMHSSAMGWEAGEGVWSVKVGPGFVVRVVGQPPEQLDPIISETKAEQENSEADLFFDIPAKLAESICGFMLGEVDPDAVQHVSLKSKAAEPREAVARETGKPGFFARLFGRA